MIIIRARMMSIGSSALWKALHKADDLPTDSKG